MSDFGTVFASYWSRGSGKAMRGNRNARFLGLYLLTAPCATEIGLYYLPFVTLCHEMEFTPEEAREAIQACSEAKFAHYDEDAELVWIPNAAEKRFGATLSAGDRKRKWIGRQVASHGNHRFVRQFMTRYGEGYGLLPDPPDPNPQMPHPMPHPMPPSSLLFSTLSSGVVVCAPGSSPDLTPPVGSAREAPAAHIEAASALANTGTVRDGNFGMTSEAWREGVTAATGQHVPTLSHAEVRDVQRVLESAPGLKGEALMAWAKATAQAYATHELADSAGRYGITPRRCVAWLTAGRPPPREAASGTRFKSLPTAMGLQEGKAVTMSPRPTRAQLEAIHENWDESPPKAGGQ